MPRSLLDSSTRHLLQSSGAPVGSHCVLSLQVWKLLLTNPSKAIGSSGAWVLLTASAPPLTILVPFLPPENTVLFKIRD